MCKTFLMQTQEKRGDEWVTINEVTLPPKDAPTCGCWLFMDEEDWERVEEAHRDAGYIDELAVTKENTRLMTEIFQNELNKILADLSCDWTTSRLLITRLE